MCYEQFQHLRPLSGLFELSKQTAERKQIADLIKILKFHSKHLCFKSLSSLFEISKQTAEGKQTADLIKISKFSFQTSLL